MPRIRPAAACALALALTCAAAVAQEDDAETNTAGPLAVGQQAPDFTLPDVEGTAHSLAALRGETRAVLVFFRGAW